MSDVPVVWLSETGTHRDEAARALGDWARARGVILSEPASAPRPLVIDGAVAERVDKELATALAADDDDDVARALGRAESTLRDHPEAPAAPFLRAEVLRAWSRLRLRQGDEAGAASAWQDAAALDGGRVAGIGEKSAGTPAKVRLRIHADAELTVDGRAATDASGSRHEFDVVPGEHAIVATRDGAVVEASWLAVRGPLSVTLPLHDDTCSMHAFRFVKREGDRVVAPGASSCRAWIAAEPTAGGVRVARCSGEACGSLVEWQTARRDVFALPPRERSSAPLPPWATWTVVGISAVTVASIVLVAVGAFDARPVEQRFVVGGTRSQ